MLALVIDVKPGTSSSSSQCPDRMQSQEDHQRSWESRPEQRKRCGGGRRMVSWGRLACENFIAQMVQLLHNTRHQTPDILIGASQSRGTAGSRSQAQAGVMSSDAMQYATKSLGSKMPSSSLSPSSLNHIIYSTMHLKYLLTAEMFSHSSILLNHVI